MNISEKLEILADAAKYDVACTSSGSERGSQRGGLGATQMAGCCHSFTADGRCISLLKVLLTNSCAYDCAYCACRSSNDVVRTAFKPDELADLVIEFYRRNYIEGLFLSSGVYKTPDYTCELMTRTFEILRNKRGFRGYIHAKAVPGTSPELIDRMGRLVDRVSVNLELPSRESLALLAPQKSRKDILSPMRQIAQSIAEDRETRVLSRRKHVFYRGGIQRACTEHPFAPAGQSTQLIVGATPETDLQILNLSSALYQHLSLKRVFFSAYLPLNDDARLPKADAVQLDREHRLYQADWLMRFYRFEAGELVDPQHPFLDLRLDPKASWALRHLELFPVEVNTTPYDMLLRVPGVGVCGARNIVKARRGTLLREDEVRRLGVAWKRARLFLTCDGRYAGRGVAFSREALRAELARPIDGGSHGRRADKPLPGQLSLFDGGVSFSSKPADAVSRTLPAKRRSASETPGLDALDATWSLTTGVSVT